MSTDDTLFQRFGRDFPRGAILFREGDAGGEMYVVQRGQVRISRRVGDGDQMLSVLGPGEFFGEMSTLSGRPRSATATCVDECKLLVVDGRTVETMLRANGEIAVQMIRKLADRLRLANEHIEVLLLPDATTRVATFLVAAASRERAGARLAIDPAELPTRLGLSSGAIEPILARLAHARVALPVDGGVIVPDPDRLREYVELLQLKAKFGEAP